MGYPTHIDCDKHGPEQQIVWLHGVTDYMCKRCYNESMATFARKCGYTWVAEALGHDDLARVQTPIRCNCTERIERLEEELAEACYLERRFRAALTKIANDLGLPGSPDLATDVPREAERLCECLRQAVGYARRALQCPSAETCRYALDLIAALEAPKKGE